ncbi:enoyl-CoA hydratase/isomerase family protein [Cellulomonas sp.]|uniref:enoyl-CoA hydratase/isomerase family protein n=1 Tax=Cellulomonas sp. TaxID=40001 RepID=UPI003BAD56CD
MTISVDRDGYVATITLSRPEKRNALTLDMLRALGSALEAIADDASVRVLVLRGAGKSFCVGADVLEFATHEPNSARRTWIGVGHRVTSLLATLPQPTVAVIQGHAVGGGLELALACDFRVASTSSILGLPEVGIGTLPGWGGSSRLGAAVGPVRAKEMVLLGDTVDGARAARIGLVTRAVAEDDLEEAAAVLTARLVAQPAVAIQLAKAVMTGPVAGNHQLQTFEALAGALSVASEDLHEGIAAFRDKRDPNFKGR